MIMRWGCSDRGSLRKVRGKAGGGKKSRSGEVGQGKRGSGGLWFFFLQFWFDFSFLFFLSGSGIVVFRTPPFFFSFFLCCLAFDMSPRFPTFFYIRFQDHVYTHHLSLPLCGLFCLFYFSRYPLWSLLLAASTPAFAVSAATYELVMSSLFVLHISLFLSWFNIPCAMTSLFSLSSFRFRLFFLFSFYIFICSQTCTFFEASQLIRTCLFFFQVISSLNKCHINHTRLLLNRLRPRP